VLGAIGGLLGWALLELLGLSNDEARQVDWTQTTALGAVVGLMYGLALGVGEGITAGTKSKFQRAVGTGAVMGLLGGVAGLVIGQFFYGSLLAAAGISRQDQAGFIPFLVQLVARTVGWGLIGTFVGAAVAFPSGSTQRIRNGFIGGTLGGLIGGFAFEIFAQITRAGGDVPRLIGLTSIGSAVGLVVNLVDEALKSAWVRILVGRNEGREVVIDKPAATVGRDELADVPVFGDPNVSRHHATIFRQNGRYLIQDQGAPVGTMVNGQRVSQQLLQDGDEIQLAGVRMIFYEKATAGPRRPVDAPRSPIAPMPPTAPNVCPFCGGEKDPLTGACACTPDPAAPGIPVGSAFDDPFAPASAPVAVSPSAGWGVQGGVPGAPRLVGVAGPYTGQVFPLPPEGGSIGREAGRDVALTADGSVSRRHAVVMVEGGRFVLRDEGSSNGTFVNGHRIQQQPLQSGDEIRLGGSLFRFEA
jgi:pSer/pThr/pTyr-binding forkhead associated (FHA) protein